MSEWRETTLGEVADLLVGFAFKSALFSDDPADIRLLRGVNIGQGSLDWDRCAYWPLSDRRAARYELQSGDVVLAMDRPWIGAGLKRSLVRKKDLPALLVQRVTRLRGTAQALTSFIHHLLATETFSRYVQAIVTGATVPHISESQIAAFPVRVPTLADQQRICDMLDSLDELIENNCRRIELLEKMAKAIYREWFVRFRYPGHDDVPLVDSHLGPIPDGWEIRSLFEVVEVAFGFSFKAKHFAPYGPYGVVRIRDVPAGITKTFTDEKPPLRYQIADGDVLIGMDGDFHLRQWTGGVAWLNQRVARLRPLGSLAARHLLLAIEKPIQEWNVAITGTTVAHLGKRHLEQVQILMPSPDVLAIATPVLADLAHQERVLVRGSRKLEAIRDLLLPKLVTGQIDVSKLDLDALVESVA